MMSLLGFLRFCISCFVRTPDDGDVVKFRNALLASAGRRVDGRAAFIRRSAYGAVQLEVKERPLKAGDGSGLCLRDLYEHLICLGGSGTGKTYSVLQPLWEEFFRSTHLPFGPERDRLKFGGLVIEAKGDFRDKTVWLASKYAREDDVVLFGPGHGAIYDPFGDPSETEMQQAAKLLELMKAMSGGRSGDDPFWENAARKLFLHIFLLHRAVREGSRELGTDCEPMSFALLNLMLMDRGQPRNADDVARSLAKARLLDEALKAAGEELSGATLRLEVWLNRLTPFSHASVARFLEPCEAEGVSGGCLPLPGQCGRLRQALRDWMGCGAADDGIVAAGAYLLSEGLRPRIALLADICEATPLSHEEISGCVIQFIEAAERFLNARLRRLSHHVEAPVHGVLKSLLEHYERLQTLRGRSLNTDPIVSYFREEYWSVANDKTSGSVAMTASNVVAPLAHPPFNRIFAPDPTFDFAGVIDSGLVVYLDMPSADYKKAAEVAALVMKMDFFRSMLGRPRLKNVAGLKVNQERPMVYFCDEFATVASSGEDTGEAGFLDKVREYRCACILGLQSLPMLYRRLDENEVDALLTNTAIKVFMNNTDVRTNEYASKVFGTEIKVAANWEMEGDAPWRKGEKPRMQTQHAHGERVRPGDFARLRRGDAYVRLNPRFEDHQLRKVSFVGRSIGPGQ